MLLLPKIRTFEKWSFSRKTFWEKNTHMAVLSEMGPFECKGLSARNSKHLHTVLGRDSIASSTWEYTLSAK